MGNRYQNLKKGIQQLNKHPHIWVTDKSHVYQSPAMYQTNQDDFYNMVVEIDTNLIPLDLLTEITKLDDSYYRAYELLIDIEVSREDLDQAIIYGNTALIKNPDAYSILGRLAAVYNEKSEYVKAKDNAKSSLKVKKNYTPALFELGIAEMNLCNKVAAKDAFNKCKRDRNYRRTASDYLKQENFEYYTQHCN